jgi:uncharacterized SAM-binding protein YcdF (DUF218 family)
MLTLLMRCEDDDVSTPDSDNPSPRSRGWTARRVVLWLTPTVAFLLFAAAITVLPLVRMVRNPDFDVAPVQADAVLVFAGESDRLELALELVDQGVSGTLVVSLGTKEPLIARRCGTTSPVEVLCPEPQELNTRGEARMFGAIARERGWGNVVAVTGDYHGARARMLLDRCFEGAASFALVDWHDVGWSVVRKEVAGLWVARFLDRSC